MVTQVLIEDVPPEYRHPVLRYYMEKLTNGKIACKVTLHGNCIAAAFQQPIGKRSFLKYTMIFEYVYSVCADINFLISQSRMFLLAGRHYVRLTPLPPSSTLRVSNLNPSIKDFVLRLHFEKFTNLESVTDVQMLGSNEALVTFKSSRCK